MKAFEENIINKLQFIDEKSADLRKEEKNKIIDELLEDAKRNNSEVWVTFLKSERAYYNGNLTESYELVLKAHELDKKTKGQDGIPNSYILNSLAVSYYSLERYEDAIKCYLELIKSNSQYYQAYVDLTTVYRKIVKYAEAERLIDELLSKISALDGDVYFQAIEAKGRLYLDMQRYGEANQILLGIFEQKKFDSEYLDALALSYVYLKDYNNAIRYFKQAYQLCRDDKIRQYLEIKIQSMELSERQVLKDDSQKMILGLSQEKIEIMEEVFSNMRRRASLASRYEEKYEQAKKQRSIGNSENYIICLKGWSSSTPEMSLGLSERNHRFGGGFYIRYNGKGIVIDPGLNFFENLHSNNLFIQDIDIVIVTHSHIDHNSDLGKIIDMDYQLNKNIFYYIDKETYAKFNMDLENVEKKSKKYVTKIYPDGYEKEFDIKTDSKMQPIKMYVCQTEHACVGSFGFKIILGGVTLGYTSDTKATLEIIDFFKTSDIIIANISETNLEDMMLQKLKESHLGIFGVYKILDKMENPNVVCLLTEFYGGFGDIRLEMADIIKEYLNKKSMDIVPMDIGLKYFYDNNKFQCNSCGRKVGRIKRTIVRMGNDNKSLFCLCNNCAYR